MSTVGFFNNKGGVGKTTLVHHLAHMLVDLGHRVLMLDLDPQSNLSAMCLSEDRLDELWPARAGHEHTVLGCVQPILRGIGDITDPHVERLRDGLGLVPGDLGLSTFEDELSDAWPRALDGDEAAYRAMSAFHRIGLRAAAAHRASVVLVDVGPNLGAINRAALLSTEHMVTPLAPDLFSMEGLRNLGPTLVQWRRSWRDRLDRRPEAELALPSGRMNPLGYLVMQAGMRLSRPVKAYDRWVRQIPGEYHLNVLHDGLEPPSSDEDPYCIGVLRHYQSLMPLAKDARKPMFHLKPADGAIGAHVNAVERCRADFERLAGRLLERLQEPLLPRDGIDSSGSPQ
ncbi:MAG: ParA family protein [Nannocystaceae bacterium]